MTKPHLKTRARELRQQGLSINDIAKTIGASKGSVSLWVRDIELTEVQLDALEAKKIKGGIRGQMKGAQANRDNAHAKREAYQAVGRAKAKEMRPMHMMGCMLYWAEGAKGKNNLNFVNSDGNMMAFFMRFLREELEVSSEDIAIHIICHFKDEVVVQNIEEYWLSLLHLPSSCLRKTVYKQGTDKRHNRLDYGVCSIRIYKTEVVQHVYGAIQEYAGFEHPAWLA